MQLPSLYQSSEKMRSPPHNTFCRLCTDKEPRQQLRSHTRWGRHSFPQIQTTPSSAPRHYEKCGCCTVVNVAPPNLSVPVAATKFRMSWCFSKMSKLSHFQHLIDFLWCMDAFTAEIIWSRLWWVDELYRSFWSYLYFTLLGCGAHSFVFSAQPSSSSYCWSHSYTVEVNTAVCGDSNIVQVFMYFWLLEYE